MIMASNAGYPDDGNPATIKTCEKIVEVPMVQIIEKIVEVPTDDIERWRREHGSEEDQYEKMMAQMEVASFDTPLAVPADPAAGFHHPKEAYLGDDVQKGLDFFRDNGFLIIPDAVSQSVVEAARFVVERDGVRDNESPEVLNALDGKIWDTVKLLVNNPCRPVRAQIARNPRFNDAAQAGHLDSSKKFYFPQDMHIDGLPNEATGDIMNFSVLVGIPLDATPKPFCGNFGVSPGSHVRIQDGIKSRGLDVLRTRNWLEPLKSLSEVHDHPFLPVCAEPGQAYIAHYQTVHFVMPNFHGCDPRRVMYYRVWNRRGDGFYMQADLDLMTDIFREFPRITGVPRPIPRLEKKRKSKAAAAPQRQEIFTKHDGVLPDGGDIFVATMTVKDAKAVCQQLPGCKGFTFPGTDDDKPYLICFKNSFQVFKLPPNHAPWTSYKYEAPFVKHDGFLADGGDLLVAKCTVEEAKCKALELPGCQGFTFHGADGDGQFAVHFKSCWHFATHPQMVWTSYKYTGPPIVAPPPPIENYIGGNMQGQGVVTVEKIVEVPMIQIVEKIVEIPSDEFEKHKEEIERRQKEFNDQQAASLALPPSALLNSPLAEPADISRSLYHPVEAYLGEDRSRSLRFFRDNGFLILPDAVSSELIEAARMAVNRDGVRDTDAPEVMSALRDSGVWDSVKMLVADPQFPAKSQIAKCSRVSSEFGGDVDKQLYFPNDIHIDGLPSGATNDIMNFTVLVGIPLDATPERFAGNFGVMPGSHQRLADAFKKEGADALRTVDWFEPLKRMSGADNNPCLPLRVVPGQAYIAHWQTIHFVMPNFRGADCRRVCYFRIWNKRGADDGFYMKADSDVLTDIWREFPAVQEA